eukprot:CAMPEP_0174958028 /NCGR_PEP_ID=MMETSP0004_2-20121128/2400_1 /TAXON_ID=420556 /ORGANISM="Ochromonas sp., Strain CCMP1393" /LENGTH=352 /DNA_ID=CAMNT_0016206203 /DNA_START=188 /DNA_END=1246 /DNA_ORIENTATION=+
MADPTQGNLINEQILSTVGNKLQLFQDNQTISALFVASQSPDIFSLGLAMKQLPEKARRKSLIAATNSISNSISTCDKECIVVYSGEVAGTAYATFATSKYKLGTASTKLHVRDLLDDGRLPLGGGLAHHLAKAGEHGGGTGYAIARYLAITGRSLTAHDLYMLGLLTHIVEEEPHFTLADSLAHTFPDDDSSKWVQGSTVDPSSLETLLDAMHIYMPDEDAVGGAGKSLLSHPVWNQAMLVPPQPIPIDSFFESEEAKEREEDFEDIQSEVIHCFGPDDIAECRQRIQLLAAEQSSKQQQGVPSSLWAVHALKQWDSIQPPALVEEWFSVTKAAAVVPISKIYKLEESIVA